MIINFNFTRQNSNGEIEFFNSRGQVVKIYPLSDLKAFVSNLIGTKHDDQINDHLDDLWQSVTQDFYNAMNQTEHIANTTPQQNRRI